VVATTDHGGEIIAAVEAGNISGTQFHPEKSGVAGLRVYVNFIARCTAPVRA
jgi:imidazoleglycerol phosphate synthase glutamine amidotransferase subunit HisH